METEKDPRESKRNVRTGEMIKNKNRIYEENTLATAGW
jgi:hypothetical protein